MKVLFVTQPFGFHPSEPSFCGVGIAGNLLAQILTQSTEFLIVPLYTSSLLELESKISSFQPNVIIYNFHLTTCPWLYDSTMRKRCNNIIHIMIHYDMTQARIDGFAPEHYCGFHYIVSDDDTLKGSDHVFITTRILPPTVKFQIVPSAPSTPTIPIIGFQGFGLKHKGLHKVAQQVQKEFDQAVIRLHLPYSVYADPDGKEAKARVQEMRNIIKKPGIRVIATHKFMTTDEIVSWLSENTINCYFYDYLDGLGVASSPNFALAARKPIAVTRSHQLRNFWNLQPSVCIEQRSLREIIASKLEPLEPLYAKYTTENVLKDYHRILTHVLSLKKK